MKKILLLLLVLLSFSSCEFQTIDVKPKNVKNKGPSEDSNEFSFQHLEDGELTVVDPGNWQVLEAVE